MIRDESIKTLAAAMGPPNDMRRAASLLRSPLLGRRLDLGTAWDLAVAALPEGWMLGHVGLYANQTWGEGWSVHALSDGGREIDAKAGDLTDALAALAAALRERER